jgi:hypothetical protein
MVTNNTANGAAAVVAQAAAVVAQAAQAVVATLCNTVATLRRLHTRGTTVYASYGVAGCKGIVFAQAAPFGAVPPTTLTFTAATAATPVPQGSTLLQCTAPGLAQGSRYGYTAPGIPGMVIHGTMLPTPVPPYMLVNAVLTAPGKPNPANVTSAVVAAGNVAQASKAATLVATPTVVAQVAAQAIVNATPKATGKTAAQRKAHGKTVA